MSTLMRALKTNIMTDNQALAASQVVYFLTAPLMFLACVVATVRFAGSPFEIFLGLVAGAILTFQMIGVGLIFSKLKR